MNQSALISLKEIEIQEIEQKISKLKKEYIEISIEYDKYHGKNWNVNWTYGEHYTNEKTKVSEKIESLYRELRDLDPLRFNKGISKYAEIFRKEMKE